MYNNVIYNIVQDSQ